MKYQIDYYNLEFGAHIFSVPQYTNSEHVEVDSEEKLFDYISTKKDLYGGIFKKDDTKFMGFDFISNSGGVKVKKYEELVPLKFKNIN